MLNREIPAEELVKLLPSTSVVQLVKMMSDNQLASRIAFTGELLEEIAKGQSEASGDPVLIKSIRDMHALFLKERDERTRSN